MYLRLANRVRRLCIAQMMGLKVAGRRMEDGGVDVWSLREKLRLGTPCINGGSHPVFWPIRSQFRVEDLV